jgi:hypothetical protein
LFEAIVTFVATGKFVIPVAGIVALLAEGTIAGLQFEAVAQSVEVAPVQVMFTDGDDVASVKVPVWFAGVKADL